MRLDHLNEDCNGIRLAGRNALLAAFCYPLGMAAPRHDWYLVQWLRTLGKKQADIVNDLGWNKARVSLTARGLQPYDREDINEIADYLNLRPYELLMHPDDAMRMRTLRSEMIRLAHENETIDDETESRRVSTG